MSPSARTRTGFTVIELFFIIVGLVLGFVSAMAPMGRARAEARHLKDSTHVRALVQASAIWAQNQAERYPIPSRLDLDGSTLPRPDGLRTRDLRSDTTGNVLSLLIFNGFIPTELTVSPAEAGNVAISDSYRFANPPAAIDPARALWDPSFRGTPLDAWGGKVPGGWGEPSHNSYAQVAYFGGREHLWSNTFSAVQASWGNRGPAYTLERNVWVPLRNSPFGDASITHRIHGEPETWEGNIGYNDQHVDFATSPDPETVAWHFPGLEDQLERDWPDNLFHSEHDSTRQPIPEGVELVALRDGRGTVQYSGNRGGDAALDQQNNYLRPIARVLPGEGNTLAAHIWID